MSVEIDQDIPGLAEANSALDAMIAADAAGAAGVDSGKGKTGESAQAADEAAGQRAGQKESRENAQDQISKPSDDTPAAADAADKDKAKAEGQEKAKEPSRYEKARTRADKSWAEINASKEALKKEREEFNAKREEFEAKRKQVEEEFSPEQYDKAAKQFEDEGKFDLAELAKRKAEELRKNPPAKREDQAKQAQEALSREWTLKAGIDFPELAKDKSPLQVRVAELFREEPDLKAHPKGIYLAARLASLETASAGVPKMEKELVQLRAKVKELETLTAPGGEQTVTALPNAKTFEQKSDAEQFDELTRMAAEMGPLR